MTLVKTKYNRRSFLKVSAATGGGMVIGFNFFAGCTPATEEVASKAIPNEWFDINAYLKIGDTGLVTIMSLNPEIGQNVKTSMPMIVAEELDVAWKDVTVEQANLNTEWYKRQVAGGSQSIRQGWDSLRRAGATARQMLVNVAAKKWEIDPKECTVSEGVVMNPKGEKLHYGELAAGAVGMEVPEEVELKAPKDYKIIGKDTPNVDIENIITGKPLFGLDYKRDGMQYAVVLRAPAFGQQLDSFDDTAARAVNGVKDVIQFKDEWGDKIAVLANSTWAAMKGKKALTANWSWGKDAAPESTSEHNATMRAMLYKTAEPVRQNGDVAAAFAKADQVLERVYEAPFLPHNCMEPMNFFAHVTTDKAELVGPIQTPQWTQSRVANHLGWVKEDMDDEAKKEALNKVTIEMTRMGGGFGRRLYGDFAMEAAKISQLAKTPVKVVFSREDDMGAGTYRPSTKYKIKAAIKDGQLSGYHLAEAAINSNMWSSLADSFPAAAVENYQVDNHKLTSNITTGAWRAPYTNFLAYAEQSFFDELAESLNQDPVVFRLNLLGQAKRKYAEIEKEMESALAKVTGKNEEEIQKAKDEVEAAAQKKKGNYEPEKMIGVIKLAAEKSNWGKTSDDVYQGFSVYFSHNTYVAEVADVVMEDGQPVVKKMTCAVDCGIVINPLAARNQIEGGIIDGIGHAMFGDFTFENGSPQQQNFHNYRMIRMNEIPAVDVHFVKSENSPTGLGEPSLPPAGGAIANAMYAATKTRLYSQPFIKQMKVPG